MECVGSAKYAERGICLSRLGTEAFKSLVGQRRATCEFNHGLQSPFSILGYCDMGS